MTSICLHFAKEIPDPCMGRSNFSMLKNRFTENESIYLSMKLLNMAKTDSQNVNSDMQYKASNER